MRVAPLCAIVAAVATGACKFHFDELDGDAATSDTGAAGSRQLDVTVTGRGVVTGDGGIACIDHCTYTVTGAVALAAQPVQAWQIASFEPCGGATTSCTIAADVTAVTVDFTQAPITANQVFVVDTTSLTAGLGALDTACHDAATAASLSGTFVAFVSTAAQSAGARLAGSRGWVRVDGMPILDQPGDLGSTTLVHSIAFDATGAYGGSMQLITTGTAFDGFTNAGTCADWTSTTGTTYSTTPDAIERNLAGYTNSGCAATGAILCFETGHVQPVDVLPSPFPIGRYVFVTNQILGTGAGVAGLDQGCATEAADANLPGTYVAAVATTTSTIEQRLGSLEGPWRRPDGVLVTLGRLDTVPLDAGITVDATGTQLPLGLILDQTAVGATGLTTLATSADDCNDWTASGTLRVAEVDSADPFDEVFGLFGCGGYIVMCAQQ